MLSIASLALQVRSSWGVHDETSNLYRYLVVGVSHMAEAGQSVFIST
jgi:hypothetical protein